MRKKIVARRAVPKRVTLPNGTSFVSRYFRISRKHLTGSITVCKTRATGSRNKRKTTARKKGNFLSINITQGKACSNKEI